MDSLTNSLITLSWSQILLTLLTLLIVRVAWSYLKLWLFLQSLKKKGAEICFRFPLGIIHKSMAETKKGDSFAWCYQSSSLFG